MFLLRRKDPDLAWYEDEVARHQNRLYNFARYHLRDDEESRDVVQDTLVSLWTHRDRIDRTTTSAWLTRVCRNSCIDRIRRRTTRNTTPIPADDLLPDRESAVDERLHLDDLQRRALALLDELEEPFKSLVILRDIQDMSYDEIAVALQLPMNTVKVYLHRARKRLRTRLAQEVRNEH